MGRAITSHVLQMHGVVHSTIHIRLYSVAGLVGAPIYAKALSAILEHLRHEGETVEATLCIEG
jgi:hypothetical protein